MGIFLNKHCTVNGSHRFRRSRIQPEMLFHHIRKPQPEGTRQIIRKKIYSAPTGILKTNVPQIFHPHHGFCRLNHESLHPFFPFLFRYPDHRKDIHINAPVGIQINPGTGRKRCILLCQLHPGDTAVFIIPEGDEIIFITHLNREFGQEAIIIRQRHGQIKVIIPGDKPLMSDCPQQCPAVYGISDPVFFTEFSHICQHFSQNPMKFLNVHVRTSSIPSLRPRQAGGNPNSLFPIVSAGQLHCMCG